MGPLKEKEGVLRVLAKKKKKIRREMAENS